MSLLEVLVSCSASMSMDPMALMLTEDTTGFSQRFLAPQSSTLTVNTKKLTASRAKDWMGGVLFCFRSAIRLLKSC